MLLLLFLLDTPAAGSSSRAEVVGSQTALFDVPEGPSSLVLRAPVGTGYEIRFRTDGVWGEPIGLVATASEGPDDADEDAMVAVGPVRVSAGADRVEIVVATGPPTIEPTFLADADLEDGTTAGTDPGARGDTAGEGPEVAGFQQVQAGERPAIMPRSAWAAEGWAYDTNGCENGPSYADNLQAVVVHHTVTTNNYAQDEVDDLLRAIYHAHVKVNGWCDIGYNFVVDRFGTIWEARTGGADRPVIGGHAKGFNTATAGIALLGQHHPGASPRAVVPTDSAAAAVQALAGWKLRLHGVDPGGTTWLKNRSSSGPQRLTSGHWHHVPTVLGHRDLGSTSCPGNHGLALARRLPELLGPSHPGPAPYRWDGWQPAEIGSGFVVVDHTGHVRPAGTASLPGIGSAPDAGRSASSTVASARAIAARPAGGIAEGYVLDGDGGLTPFGGAPAETTPTLGAPAVDLALGPSGGWVVAANGAIVGFGGQRTLQANLVVPTGGASARSARPIVAADLDSSGDGYLLDAGGRLLPVGSAPPVTLADVGPSTDIAAVDLAVRPRSSRPDPDDAGGWVLDATGTLHPFGGAPAVAVTAPRQPPVDLARTAVVASASGYGGWILTSDGQLWPFGHERLVFPATTLNQAAGSGGVDVATLPPTISDDVATSATGRYLAALVELFLDRPATAADLGHWHARLSFDVGPPRGRRAVTVGLARSNEWAGQRVDDLYRDVLGRPADPEGRRYWVEAMADGLRFEQVGVYFYGSAEYVGASGSAERYVDRLYEALLDRPADLDGRRYWAEQLASGRSGPPEVAAGFYASVESRRGRVGALYGAVLGRGPDATGLDYWSERLLDFDDILLAAELAASDEFYNRSS